MHLRLLLLLSLLCSQNLFSQTSKGDWLVNGTLSFNNFNETTSSLFVLNTQPRAGYFLFNNFVLGTGFPYRITESGLSKITTIGLAPFSRVYFGRRMVRPFIQLDYSMTRIVVKSKTPSIPFPPITSTKSLWFARLGIDFFLAENIAIETSFDYLITEKIKEDNGFNTQPEGLSMSLGMNYFITGKKESEENAPLKDRYLKKGSNTFGINGLLDFEPVFLGQALWYKFLSDRLRLRHQWNIFYSSDAGDLDNLTFIWYTAGAQPFFSLKPNTFFAPAGGLSYYFGLAGQPTTTSHDASLFLHPALTHFFDKGLLELGMEFRYFFGEYYSSEDAAEQFSGNAMLGFEFFLNKNVSLRGEVWANFFGPSVLTNELQFFNETGETHFRLGFNYFLEKKAEK